LARTVRATATRFTAAILKASNRSSTISKGLGATAIWISPVLLNPYGEYHGYLTFDPYQIDPHWGTFDDMTNMIAAAHARGIYVIVDVICNHPADLIYSTDSQFLTTFRAPPNGYTLQWRDPARQYPAAVGLERDQPDDLVAVSHEWINPGLQQHAAKSNSASCATLTISALT